MIDVNFIKDSNIFEFRETITINGTAHDFLFYAQYLSHKVINDSITDYIEILKIYDIDKFLNGDESRSIIVRYENRIPQDLIKYINRIRYSEGKRLISQ